MGNLIRNENMKLYRRARTWIMIGLLIAILFFISFVKWYDVSNDPQSSTWQERVVQEKQSSMKLLQIPDLTKENRSLYEDSIVIYDYHLEHNIRTDEGTIWGGIHASANLIILITLFTVIVAGDSLAGEFASGTIKLLLIRPVSRQKILLSKYMSMILFGILLLVILFILSILINAILYGYGNIDLPLIDVNNKGEIVEQSMVANLWKTYLLNGVSTIMFVTIAFMISSAFRSSAMAIGFSLFALFAGAISSEFFQSYAWGKYILFANIDLSQYLTGSPYQEGMTLTFSVIILCAYFIVFNLVSWFVFTKRDVAA